jgi:uncharacterized protein YjiS (DUF1127 family)
MRFSYRIRHGMTIGETDGERLIHHEPRRRTAMPALASRIARPAAHPTAGLAPAPLLAALVARLRLWRRLRAERRSLMRLDARLLRDIGLDAAAAAREAARPFWDVPPGR